jgi:hypothetical protein
MLTPGKIGAINASCFGSMLAYVSRRIRPIEADGCNRGMEVPRQLADRSIRISRRIARRGADLRSYTSKMSPFRQEFILPCQDLIFILHNMFSENRLHAFPADASRVGRVAAHFAVKTPRI